MVAEQLVSPTDLSGFRGAPFTPNAVNGACESVRRDCEWHIAPTLEQSVRLRGGDTLLRLPTLYLVEVVSVTSSKGVAVNGFDWLPNGVLERESGFPAIVDVVFRHGYESCPPELLNVVAERAANGSFGRVRQESLGSRSVSLESGYDAVSVSVLDKYRLFGRP